MTTRPDPPPYPFSALVAQDRLTTALLVGAVDPRIGGVLVRGHKGTAKSTAVRGLAALLPSLRTVVGCRFSCPPDTPAEACGVCRGDDRRTTEVATPLVELPLGASEDRVLGSIDLERALADGVRAFEPGLLARAHRGVLYVDEVNLLDDHLVDVLLDAAAMGVNHVEREGVSVRHPALFQLVGTMNPEEGELRPQLLDRFGLTVEVEAPADPGLRVEVVRRRLAFEADPDAFAAGFAAAERTLADRVVAARERLGGVVLAEGWLTRIVEVCAALEVDGLRADIVTARTATALAAWRGGEVVEREDVRTACLLALPHRRRRGPFDDPGLDEDELDRLLGDDDPPPDGGGQTPERGERDPEPADGPTEPSGTDEPAPSAPSSQRPGHDHGPDQGHDAGEPDGAPPPTPRDEPPPAADTDDGDAEIPHGDGDGDDGAASDTAAAGRPAEPATEVGAAPRLVTGRRRDVGVAGRRSPGTSVRGAPVGSRPLTPGETPRGSELALGATLRAAAPVQRHRGRGDDGLVLRRDDLRHHVRRGRQGTLIAMCVDASGSMGARRRMAAVKGAVRALLLDAYQRRDLVSLVTFRGERADVALPPTAGVELAERRLAELPTGGRTPLAAGLRAAGRVITTHARRDPDRQPLLVVVTDGRATGGPGAVADAHRTAAQLAARRVPAVVIDTEQGFVRLGLAAELARCLGAPHVEVDELAAGELTTTIRAATGRAA